jgi:hypothetical protein
MMCLASLLVCCADVRIDVLEGRVALASSEGVRTMAREHEAVLRMGPEPGFVDVPAGSRVRFSFPGSGSLVLVGAAQFEWSLSSSGAWQWQLDQLGEAHLELRGGGVDLELPGGWAGRVQAAALWVKVLPSGELLIRHDGGRTLSLRSPSAGRGPGGRLGFEPGECARVRTRWSAPTPVARTVVRAPGGPRPWRGFGWPWPASTAPEERTEERPDPPAVEPAPPESTGCQVVRSALRAWWAWATPRAREVSSPSGRSVRTQGQLEASRWGARLHE